MSSFHIQNVVREIYDIQFNEQHVTGNTCQWQRKFLFFFCFLLWYWQFAVEILFCDNKFSFGELSVIDWDFDFDFEGWGEWEKFQLVWN